ncbi:hypothetical protein ACTXT7_004934 [Hymenolepis weldensis]
MAEMPCGCIIFAKWVAYTTKFKFHESSAGLQQILFYDRPCSLNSFMQPERVASSMHRQETVECLKKFNAKRKLKK